MKRPVLGQTKAGSGAGRPNGQRKRRARTRSSRPGTSILEWSPREAGAVVGERKVVTSGGPVLKRRKGCGVRRGVNPGLGENGLWGAELRGVRRFGMRCSVPCMPVVNKAGNQVT